MEARCYQWHIPKVCPNNADRFSQAVKHTTTFCSRVHLADKQVIMDMCRRYGNIRIWSLSCFLTGESLSSAGLGIFVNVLNIKVNHNNQ